MVREAAQRIVKQFVKHLARPRGGFVRKIKDFRAGIRPEEDFEGIRRKLEAIPAGLSLQILCIFIDSLDFLDILDFYHLRRFKQVADFLQQNGLKGPE